MSSSGRTISILFGIAAGAALTGYVLSRKGGKIREKLGIKLESLKDEVLTSMKEKLESLKESENIFI